MHSTVTPEQSDTSAAENIHEKSTFNRVSRTDASTSSLRRSMSETSHHLNRNRPGSPAFSERSHIPTGRRFINPDEIDRISADLEERRSERSSNASITSGNGSHDMQPVAAASRAEVPRSRLRELQPRVEDEDEDESHPALNLAPAPESQLAKLNPHVLDSHQRLKGDKKKPGGSLSNPPFPRISADLERMFFSSARHNTNACRMCRDRRSRCHAKEAGAQRDKQKGESDGGELSDVSNSPGRDDAAIADEGPSIEDLLERMNRNEYLRPSDIPPQTILSRVLREMEDEFTHYKEYVACLQILYRITQTPTLGFIGNLPKNIGRWTVQRRLRSATWLPTTCGMLSTPWSVKYGLSTPH